MTPRILAAALCLSLLCGCAPILTNTEDLLVPPRLNERQTKVEEALSVTTGLSGILYRYPQRGDYRSPFVFFDMDRDGALEAMVFYTDRSGDNVRAKVMRENPDGSWSQLQDLSGGGDQVDFVQFSNVLASDSYCVIIGWRNTRRGTATLEVHSFTGERLKREVQSGYHSLSIDDYLGDGLSEILLVRQDASGYYQLNLLGRTPDGRLALLGELELSHSTASILQMRRGRLGWELGYGVYIDALREDSMVATEVVRVSREGLTGLVVDEDSELYVQTLRDDESLCVDLREDGVVEIPTLVELPGYFEGEIEPPPLTRYMRLDNGRMEVVDYAAVNAAAGYLVYFPPRWVDAVTIQRSPESNEWRFHKLDSETGLPSAELLRIRVYSIRDYQDQFVVRNYELLAEKGLFQYYAYIPPAREEPLAVTKAELSGLFSLL